MSTILLSAYMCALYVSRGPRGLTRVRGPSLLKGEMEFGVRGVGKQARTPGGEGGLTRSHAYHMGGWCEGDELCTPTCVVWLGCSLRRGVR